jgi:hypothetical protein
MGDSYSRSPFLLRGAIVQFGGFPIIPLPIPQIILFQYNPDSMTRSLTPFNKPEDEAKMKERLTAKSSKLDAGFDPEETFNLTLFLDATDHLETPDQFPHQITVVTGVADRLSALELLLYPEGDGLLKNLLSSAIGAIGGGSTKVKIDQMINRGRVPITLFFFGPGRLVPVRLTSFNVEETWWNVALYPLRAKVTIGMKVITANDLATDDRVAAQIARGCYDFTRAQKEILAALNIANTVESIAGMF